MAHANLATYAYARNRPDVYLEEALRARELDPMQWWTHQKVIYGMMMLGRSDEIPGSVTRMNDLFGSEPRAAALACHARSSTGRQDERLACALRALRRFPDSPEIIEAIADACGDLGDYACMEGATARLAARGDEDAAMWLLYLDGDKAGIQRAVAQFLVDPRHYGRAELMITVSLAAGLDDEALRVFRAAGIDRGTIEDAVFRHSAMEMLLQMIAVERRWSETSHTGRQLDKLLEWTGRPLEHGGKEYLFHVDRAFALGLVQRKDEAIAEIAAAARAPGAPFDVRLVTDSPAGRVLARDPRLEPLLKNIRDTQAALRAKLPATLKAAGVDPAELTAIQKAYLKPT